jgi:hypothetical protein
VLTLPASPLSSSAPVGRTDRRTRTEQETVISWDRAADQVRLWSADPVTWRKLARLGFVPVRETHGSGGGVTSRFYTIPLNRFAWGVKRVGTARVPPRRRPVLSGLSQNVA